MYELIHFLDIALIFIAYNCTQSHKGRPQNHQKRPIYVVKHQVRDLARPCATLQSVSFCTSFD